jgi:hypothetical protein
VRWQLPNVLQATFSWPAQWRGGRFASTVPNQPLRRGGDDGLGSTAAAAAGDPGLLLVSRRPLSEGEELFVNYRYNPAHEVRASTVTIRSCASGRRYGCG